MRIVPALCTLKLVKRGCITYLVHFRENMSIVPFIKLVLVMCKFLEVFPDNHPGIPPYREVYFYIDLEPRTQSIFIIPQCMEPI